MMNLKRKNDRQIITTLNRFKLNSKNNLLYILEDLNFVAL